MTLPTVAVLKGSLRVDVTGGVADQEVRLVVPGVDGHAVGAFSIDFSDYPDGAVPAEETGLRDNFLDDPDNEDEMGIVDGKLAIVDFRGPDQAFSGLGQGGGRRGFLYRNTVTLTDNVSGPVESVESPGGGVDGSPVLHVNNDFEGSQYVGLACWFIPPPFSWTELGVIGRLQEDFSYLDLTLGTTVPSPGDTIFIRSVGGFVSVEVNGATVCGPCEIPVGLLGSAIHGVQMDLQEDIDEAVGVVSGLTISSDSTPLGIRTTPAGAAVGTQVEANSTTIAVAYPTGIVAGSSLYCFVATANGGTVSASGWTDVQASFGVTAGIGIRVLRKTAVGSESGTLTVTKSTSGVMAAFMMRVTGDTLFSTMAGQGNTSSTSMPSPAIPLYGPYRLLLWMGATSIDTTITCPATFTPVATGVVGGQAIRLAVAGVFADTHPDFPDPPIFGAYDATHFPSQTGTALSAATSAVGLMIIHPANGT